MRTSIHSGGTGKHPAGATLETMRLRCSRFFHRRLKLPSADTVIYCNGRMRIVRDRCGVLEGGDEGEWRSAQRRPPMHVQTSATHAAVAPSQPALD